MKYPRSPKLWKVIAALLVIFGAGQGFGFMLASRIAPNPTPAPQKTWTDNWVEETIAQLQTELNLSDPQVAAIEPSLRETGNSIRAERQRALFQIHLNILEVHAQIDGHLTEAQKVKLQKSHDQLKRRIQRQFPEIMENIN